MDLLRESPEDKKYSQCSRTSHMSRGFPESRQHRVLSGHNECRDFHISTGTLVDPRDFTLNCRLAQSDGAVQSFERHRAVSTYAHNFCN